MGSRRQPRIPITVPANLCGMDGRGRAFVDRVRLVNMSRNGAQLEDVSCGVRVGDTVALRCEDTTRRFRVIWSQAGKGEGRQVGLMAASPVAPTLEKWLPVTGTDDYLRPRAEQRRRQTRYDCEVSAEIRPRGDSAPMWVTACDISEGGCRLQIPHAMKPQTEVTLAMWLEGERIWLHVIIIHSLYGCGSGIMFTGVQQSVRQKLASLIASCNTEVSDRRESTAELNHLCAAFNVTT